MATQFAAEAKRMMPIATELPETKRKGGRPSDKTPELLETIAFRLANGEPLATICRDKNMPHFSTVWDWETNDVNVSRAFRVAREHGTHFLADDCIRISNDEETDVQHRRLQIDTRMRLIGKWNRKVYGDAVKVEAQVEHSTAPSFDVRLLTDEQRETLRALLEAARPKPMITGEFSEVDDDQG